MVAPQYRSRSKKRVSRRMPGGKTVLHYKQGKPDKNHCGRCGKPMQGVPNANPSKMRKMSRSERIPTRIYAGILCADCTESLMRYITRSEAKFGYPEFSDMEIQRDLTIEKFLPRGWFSGISKGSVTKTPNQNHKL